MALSFALHVNASNSRHSISPNVERLKISIDSPALQPCSKDLQQAPLRVDFPSAIKIACSNVLDALVSLVFEFVDLPLLPSQRNFAPVSQLREAINVNNIEGKIPDDFPAGVYVRNSNDMHYAKCVSRSECFISIFFAQEPDIHMIGLHKKDKGGPNPLFGGLKSTKSIFGRSSHTWIDEEGMLHAVYIDKDSDRRWIVQYNNRHVETETYKQEKQRNRPSFLPAIEGDPPAILSAYLLNALRFGTVNKLISNTNVFEHGRKFYSIAENQMPREIDIFTLETLGNWNVDRDWNRPFMSHPKRAPGTGELVIMGFDAVKPFMELGIISADGKKLLHKADLKLDRCSLCHEIGVTQRYNVIMDFPLTRDINRLVRGGPLIQFNKKEYARIGIMPRYGDGNSMQWFDIETSCMFHILNCFEDGDEVVVCGCRALESIIPGPDFGLDKFQWFSKRLKPIRSSEENVAPTTEEEEEGFSRTYEWRLNVKTGEAKERNLTGTKYSMDFPMINSNFTGLKNKYGYTQVADSSASSISGMPKYGGLAKLYLNEPRAGISSKENRFEDAIKLEYHEFGENIFCTGAAFVPKENGFEEDHGWIITFAHNESTDTSQVYLIDCKNFSGEPVAKITLPCRVPYGFHGAFVSQSKQIDLQA